MMFILGVFGPWQLIALLVIAGVIVIPIVLLTSRAKHKARADVLDEVRAQDKQQSGDRLSQLERLSKLHESGALTDAEFEAEKKKLL